MPIDWNSVPDAPTVGSELMELMRELFPLPRSLTGSGVRETLAVLARELPLEMVETASGTKVFDWTIPDEWTLRGGWIEDLDGRRIVDAADSTLHVLGYSVPVDATVSLSELREHVYTHPHDPELVPYRTSYWEKRWGFCMSQRQLDALPEGAYRVVVDSTLTEGSLTTGEVSVQGASEDLFLLSTYTCHPALANDNLSGVVLTWALARTLFRQDLLYTYRFLWGPGTLGPLSWLARNFDELGRIRHGLALSCVGDPGPLRYKRSRRSSAPIDRAAAHVLAAVPGSMIGPWVPLGGDERQFCSPGFDLPVGTFTRSPHGAFPEYHSSADNLDLVTGESLAASFKAVLEIIDVIETNASYRNLSPYGEPQLGRRGLYQSVPDGTNPEAPLLWALSGSDGETDLLTIAERSSLPYRAIREAAETLERHDLLERLPSLDEL